ncbi:TPA: hypothetical protein HA241_06845 [Candidatus Woesearchaeota archaeon]|nr:hypothetical protein [Candidatus Woesearchaeota archaeon]
MDPVLRVPVFAYVHSSNSFFLSDDFQRLLAPLSLSSRFGEYFGPYFLLDMKEGEKLFPSGVESWRIDGDYFQDGSDGPCHYRAMRELFWRDVFQSLHFSLELIFQEARFHKAPSDDVALPMLDSLPQPSSSVQVFSYVPALHAFVVNDNYKNISDRLGLEEWNPVVWLGRYFCLDNDYGEHWMNCDERRDQIMSEIRRLGLAPEQVYVVDADYFQQSGQDGVHSSELRGLFWRDLLSSLRLSYELLFEEARYANELTATHLSTDDTDYIADLEQRIDGIRTEYCSKRVE